MKLFSTKFGFDALDKRIAKTKTLKKELLVVLDHPYVPLHNNTISLISLTHYKLNFFTQFYPKMV